MTIPRFVYSSVSRNIAVAGFPGGVYAIPFQPDASFTGASMQAAIVAAINKARDEGATSLSAIIRADDTLFIENAVSIDSATPQLQLPNYFLRGIQDIAKNSLRPNRINKRDAVHHRHAGASLDFGDAPSLTLRRRDVTRPISRATALVTCDRERRSTDHWLDHRRFRIRHLHLVARSSG